MSCCVQHNHTLESLCLHDNEIGADGAKALAEALAVSSDTLEAAHSEEHSIFQPNRWTERRLLIRPLRYVVLCVAFRAQHNRALQTLELRWNGIDSVGATALAAALKVGFECRLRAEPGLFALCCALL